MFQNLPLLTFLLILEILQKNCFHSPKFPQFFTNPLSKFNSTVHLVSFHIPVFNPIPELLSGGVRWIISRRYYRCIHHEWPFTRILQLCNKRRVRERVETKQLPIFSPRDLQLYPLSKRYRLFIDPLQLW